MSASARRPNILFITTDQQRADALGAAGNAHIFTPHLDWLAHTGIRFARAYADCPTCMPSRATLMTGLHAWNHGLVGNGDAARPLASHPTLPALLTAAGYQTRAVGKMHFSPERAHYGFEHMELLGDYYRWIARQPGAAPPMGHGLGQNEMEPAFSTCAEHQTLTAWTVDRSIDFLETRDPTRPFFLWTSFAKPHPPLDPPASCWAAYEGIDQPDPILGDWSADVADVPSGFLYPTVKYSNAQGFTPAKWRAVRRAYHACVTHIDYTLGRLFARLRELGQLDNTWIVFASDHGEMLGDHHMAGKWLHLEASARVPLILRPPGDSPPEGGSVCERIACLADLMPTLLRLARVESPATDGLDLLELAEGRAGRERLFGRCEQFHAVWEGDHKYLFCEWGGDELLFDVAHDPCERRNLLSDPGSEPVLQRLRAALAGHLAERGHASGVAGRPLPTGHALDERDIRRKAWPGHATATRHCDVLH